MRGLFFPEKIMRSRFSIKTKLTSDELKAVLTDLHLIPRISENADLSILHRDQLFETLPNDDNTKDFVEETFRFIVYDYSESIWGIVNEPAIGIFEFRFRHDDIDILFVISQRHLDRLKAVHVDAIETAPDGEVKIFEKSGKIATMTARFVARRNTGDLLREKYQAIWSASVTFLLGILFTYFSHPRSFSWIKESFFGNDPINQEYWQSFSGRMATAFFVGTILAVYDIIFYVRTQQNSSSLSINRKTI
jgi:hypothetical protein